MKAKRIVGHDAHRVGDPLRVDLVDWEDDRVVRVQSEYDAWPEDVLTVMSADACRDGGVLRMVGPVSRTGYGGQKLVIDTPTTVRFVIQIMRFNGIFEITHEMPRSDESTSAEARRRFFNSFMFP